MTIVEGKTLIGWGVVRETPWAFAGLFGSQAEAQQRADAAGEGFMVRYGERQEDRDVFESSTAAACDGMPPAQLDPIDDDPVNEGRAAHLAQVAGSIDDAIARGR